MVEQRQIRNLDDLFDGGLTERFNVEFAKVLANVFDPNTSATSKRSITMTVNVTPNIRRDAADFRVDVRAKLAPYEAIQQTVIIHQDDSGNVTATELTNQVPGQMDMNGGEVIPAVVKFDNARKKEG